MSGYDAIVIGVGGMGSATMWHLARRGCNVLGIERFNLAHDRGSSHGGSRLIRRAYFEHPDYVPLVSRAYDLWSELEQAAGTGLFHRTGLYLAGHQPGMLIDGVLRSKSRHGLSIDTLTSAEAQERFPGLRCGPDMSVLFEADAGFLEVENCVRWHARLAIDAGATLHEGEAVRSWQADTAGIRVHTDRGSYSARSLILCGGAWTDALLKDLRLPLQIRRKVVVWYESADPAFCVRNGSPVFCVDTADGFFYGFPTMDGRTVKIGEHSGGRPTPTPDALDRELHDEDLVPLEKFIGAHLPAATTRIAEHSVCMYTMTPDEHFIIDRHPAHNNVFFACGFSGHGFKFASVIGSALADLATHGVTDEPIHFLNVRRFPTT